MDATLKDNPLAILNRILFSHDLDFHTCEPAKVVKVYSDGTVLVQPLIKIVDDNKEKGTRTEKAVDPIRVSIHNANHGGFYVEHPIMEGETGWVFAPDRNTSLVRQYNSSDFPDKNAGAQTPNNDKNLHKSHFGFFIPDRWITVPEELVKELKYPRSKDDKIFCGGAYTIGSNRNMAGNLDSSALFGVVRNSKGEDVPYTMDEEGHTRAIVGDYTGKYYWSMFRLCSDGSVDLFGQGTRFSVRGGGLYMNDRLFANLRGDIGIDFGGVNSLVGDAEGSASIKGDVSIVGAEDSGLVAKTEVVEPPKDGNPQKSKVVLDLKGRGDAKLETHDMEVYDKDGNAIGSLHFYSDDEFKIGAGDGINMSKDEDGVFKIVNAGIIGLEEGANVTIEDVPNKPGWKKISATGGGGAEVICDDRSIRYFTEGGVNKVELKHWNDTEANSTILLEQSKNIWIPCRTGTQGGELEYRMIGNLADVGSFQWDKANGYIRHVRAIASRQLITGSDFQLASNFTGTVYAIVNHPASGSITVQCATSSQSNTDERTCFKIYDMTNGIIYNDYRNTPIVPLYE